MCTYVYIRNSHMRGRERGRETTWKKRGEASISYLRGATRSTYTVEPKYGNCRSNLMTMFKSSSKLYSTLQASQRHYLKKKNGDSFSGYRNRGKRAQRRRAEGRREALINDASDEYGLKVDMVSPSSSAYSS